MTLSDQLHNSRFHADGVDSNCPKCNPTLLGRLTNAERQTLEDLQAFANELNAVVRVVRYQTLSPDFQLMNASREPLATGTAREIVEAITEYYGANPYFKNAIETFELSDTYHSWDIEVSNT